MGGRPIGVGGHAADGGSGRRAVGMLLKKIASPEETCPPEAVPYEAVFRETVAPPAA
jgi:hypothetical protein